MGDEHAFYNRSFIVDELGTADLLLEWRDALVEAGWDGAPIAQGGPRLDAIARLESHSPANMPSGDVDRLVHVERELARAPSRVYESIALVDDVALWPRRWQSVFRHLKATGASFSRITPDLRGSRAGTDLALLQARIRGVRDSGSVRGDGSILFARGDTNGDLAELTAAMLAQGCSAGALEVVVRCADAAPLDAALARHGLPAQGCSGASPWRPAMQVLPLAVELAFEPRDPYRVLELLTLPVGPFRGRMGMQLARAVARQPGLGGKEWLRQKADAARRMHDQHARREAERGRSEADAEAAASAAVHERSQRVAEWLEGPGADAGRITRAELLAVAERVRAWLRRHLRAGELDVYGPAHTQAAAFAEAVAQDTRDVLTQQDARQLVDRFGRSKEGLVLSRESAGRVAHVRNPGALLGPCDRVTFWSFVAAIEGRPVSSPWNDEERAALHEAGVSFVDPAARLRADTEAWRRAVLAAQERVVFVVPQTIKGTATTPHPFWDEIRGRLGLDEQAVALVTCDARRVLTDSGSGVARVATCAPLPLPEGRGAWAVPADVLRAASTGRKTSVTALERIATCPFAWVLEHRADVRSGAMSTVASGPLLNGGLGHRLVEELHTEGAFALDEGPFLERAEARFATLLRTEGATLLLPGASIERLQLTRQLLHAMRGLHRYLASSGFRIAGVEEEVSTDSTLGPLHGRLDLRLVARDGSAAVLDLKWGASTYRKVLERGRAVQLAAYSRAIAGDDGSDETWPAAAYFALSSGQVLATDARMQPTRCLQGPSLRETWARVEATATAVLESHDRGTIFVAAAARSLPLLDALGISGADRAAHFETARDAACGYCAYDALCGRKWEAFS